ncbi:hypothetical protein GMJAKD_10215 [Candidatus Electrothrix aarhusensis]
MSRSKGHAHCPEHMRGLQRTRGTRRSRGSADPVLVHMQENSLAFHILEADITGIGQAVFSMTVKDGFRNRAHQALLQLIPQSANAGIFLFQHLPGQLAGPAQSDNRGHIFRAAATTTFLMTTMKEGDIGRSLTYIKHSDPLWRMELMTGQGKKINLALPKIDRNLAHSLDRICVEQDTPLLGQSRHFLDRKQHPGLIVGPHHRNYGSVLGQGFLVGIQVQRTIRLHHEPGDPMLMAGQQVQGFTKILDRWMFHSGGNDMPMFRLALQGRENRCGIAFCATAGEHDFFRVRSDQLGDLRTGLLNNLPDLTTKGMHG